MLIASEVLRATNVERLGDEPLHNAHGSTTKLTLKGTTLRSHRYMGSGCVMCCGVVIGCGAPMGCDDLMGCGDPIGNGDHLGCGDCIGSSGSTTPRAAVSSWAELT